MVIIICTYRFCISNHHLHRFNFLDIRQATPTANNNSQQQLQRRAKVEILQPDLVKLLFVLVVFLMPSSFSSSSSFSFLFALYRQYSSGIGGLGLDASACCLFWMV